MVKKFSLLLAAIAVVAIAVPAFASAAPELTIGGAKAAIGAKVTGTSTNATTQTSLGKITCPSVKIEAEVKENTGTKVKAVGVGAGNPSNCKLGEKEIPVTDITLSELVSTESGKGTISVSFAAKLSETVNCSFTTGSGPFTYTSGGSSLKLTNVNLVGTPAACEPGTLNGDFALASAGGAVVLH